MFYPEPISFAAILRSYIPTILTIAVSLITVIISFPSAGMMFLTVLCTGISVYAYNDTMIQATDWDKHKKDVRNCSTTSQVVDNPFRWNEFNLWCFDMGLYELWEQGMTCIEVLKERKRKMASNNSSYSWSIDICSHRSDGTVTFPDSPWVTFRYMGLSNTGKLKKKNTLSATRFTVIDRSFTRYPT